MDTALDETTNDIQIAKCSGQFSVLISGNQDAFEIVNLAFLWQLFLIFLISKHWTAPEFSPLIFSLSIIAPLITSSNLAACISRISYWSHIYISSPGLLPELPICRYKWLFDLYLDVLNTISNSAFLKWNSPVFSQSVVLKAFLISVNDNSFIQLLGYKLWNHSWLLFSFLTLIPKRSRNPLDLTFKISPELTTYQHFLFCNSGLSHVSLWLLLKISEPVFFLPPLHLQTCAL